MGILNYLFGIVNNKKAENRIFINKQNFKKSLKCL